MKSVVLGGSGVVGGYIVQHLVRAGQRPIAVSRSRRDDKNFDWLQGDLERPEELELPPFCTLYCTADVRLFAKALSDVCTPVTKRIVVFTSTSILTKLNSEIEYERKMLREIVDAEQQIITTCGQLGIGWTILRPTLVYAEGHDRNITRMSRMIRRFGFMPLAGTGSGLRQPVHAEDLAAAALAAASSPAAINKIYAVSGKETITYREMIGRIFDGLNLPRRIISVPPFLWRAAFLVAKPFFPGFNAAMGTRMSMDMVFDHSAAVKDFGWNPREFHPHFND